MPLTFTSVRQIGLVLDLIPERLVVGDTSQFVAKMTRYMTKLENMSVAVNNAATDINAFGAELSTADIDSVYDVAVLNGYVGTASEWLLTMIGPRGPDGLTAYQIAVNAGYVGTSNQWLASLQGIDGFDGFDGLDGTDGTDGINGLNGMPGISGDGAGYTAPPWSVLTPAELTQLPVGALVINGSGQVMELTTNAIGTNYGSLPNTGALTTISNPQHGDYVTIAGDYHYYDSTVPQWVDTNTPWIVESNSTDFGTVATTTDRDNIVEPQKNDYVTISGSPDYHYYNGTTWVDSTSSVLPVVSPNPNVSPDTISSSWTPAVSSPVINSASELENITYGNYPNGVLVQDTGQIAYQDPAITLTYQQLCGGSNTAWLPQGWKNNAAIAGQAARVQAEVTANTYARVGFQPGTVATDSFLVEIQPTQIQAFDNNVAVGSPIAVGIGDIVGLFRYSNGTVIINVNKIDVYTFTRTDTSAINIYAYLFGIGYCIDFAMHGVDGNFLDPVAWDGYSNAEMTEVVKTRSGWSYSRPDTTVAISNTLMRVVYTGSGETPHLGAWPNIYPDGATVAVGLLKNTDLFTLLVSPGESVIVDGTTITIDAGMSNLEPVHFAKLGGVIERIGGNGGV